MGLTLLGPSNSSAARRVDPAQKCLNVLTMIKPDPGGARMRYRRQPSLQHNGRSLGVHTHQLRDLAQGCIGRQKFLDGCGGHIGRPLATDTILFRNEGEERLSAFRSGQLFNRQQCQAKAVRNHSQSVQVRPSSCPSEYPNLGQGKPESVDPVTCPDEPGMFKLSLDLPANDFDRGGPALGDPRQVKKTFGLFSTGLGMRTNQGKKACDLVAGIRTDRPTSPSSTGTTDVTSLAAASCSAWVLLHPSKPFRWFCGTEFKIRAMRSSPASSRKTHWLSASSLVFAGIMPAFSINR